MKTQSQTIRDFIELHPHTTIIIEGKKKFALSATDTRNQFYAKIFDNNYIELAKRLISEKNPGA